MWLITTRTRVSDATAVTFSVKCFNPLNFKFWSSRAIKLPTATNLAPGPPQSYFGFLLAASENGLLYTFYLFTSRALNNNEISNGKYYCCNDTFTDVRFTSLLAKNIQEEYKLFYAVRISIALATLSEIFIQIGYFS